ncbi:MAG: lipopolysaccharide core biosynthesis protein [Planctomycetes bacterium ADurb.Bin412]|nr:MAG: lipopolysaccharide core biosynthesis protein [Planctomycetes bacterium ADurb.Bin412]
MAKNSNTRALIIQPGALGDSILTLPLARLIIEQCDINSIDMMGHEQYLEVFQSRTVLDHILSLDATPLHPLFTSHSRFDLPEKDPLIDLFRHYDLVVSFLHDNEGHFEKNLIYTLAITHAAEVVSLQLHPPEDYPRHTSEFFMEQFIEQAPDTWLRISPCYLDEPLIKHSQKDLETGRQYLEKMGLNLSGKIIAIHPGSGSEQKCWPRACFLQIAENLVKNGLQPLFLVGPTELERWEKSEILEFSKKYHTLSNIPLSQLAPILSICDGFLGNDSGMAHLAGSMGLATLAVFGPSKSIHWKPLGALSRICQPDSGENSLFPSFAKVMREVLLLIR